MAEWGYTAEDTDKIYKFAGNGFYRREDSELIQNTIHEHNDEMEKAIADDKTGEGFIYEMFLCELRNHEYGYTGDTEYTLDMLGYTPQDLEKDKRLAIGLRKACKQIQKEEY